MKKIETLNAPSAIGPYSQAIDTGEFIFTSGQIPLSKDTGTIVGDNISDQTKQVCENLKAVVEAAGTTLDNTVKTTCFLQDIADFAEFNKIYSEYFTNKPSRSCVAVKDLPKGALVEIEAIVKK